MKLNYHTHTQLCRHAFGTTEEYVQSALKNGLGVLGFSDHAPFPEKDFGYRMLYDELTGYKNEIDRLKAEYHEKMTIYCGLEIEYLPCKDDYYVKLKDKISGFGFDYLAMGEHFYGEKTDSTKNIFFASSTDDYVEYAEYISRGLSTGLFSFLAHPDIMFYNDFAFDSNCRKACDIILTAVEKNNVPVEFNANGLRREKKIYPDGKRHPYPYLPFWEIIRGSNIRVIIGADSHTPDQVRDSDVEQAYEICDRMNLNVITSDFLEGI